LQERGSADSKNEEEFAGFAFGAREVNWWSGKEERKKQNGSRYWSNYAKQNWFVTLINA